jgi:hypothetical protein
MIGDSPIKLKTKGAIQIWQAVSAFLIESYPTLLSRILRLNQALHEEKTLVSIQGFFK